MHRRVSRLLSVMEQRQQRRLQVTYALCEVEDCDAALLGELLACGDRAERDMAQLRLARVSLQRGDEEDNCEDEEDGDDRVSVAESENARGA